MKIGLYINVWVLATVAAFAADSASAKQTLADDIIKVGQPDRAKVRRTEVVSSGSPIVSAELSSRQDFERFVLSLKAGQQLKWEIGCNYADLVARDANGKEQKREDGKPAFILPLGAERVPLTEIEKTCAARGVVFKFGFGY